MSEETKPHLIFCAEAEARSKRGEQILLTPGPCWCGSPESKPLPKKRRQSRLEKLLAGRS